MTGLSRGTGSFRGACILPEAHSFLMKAAAALKETVGAVRTHCQSEPLVGLILGSGLASYADSFSEQVVIPYNELPNFPPATVPGHPGNLVFGKAAGVAVAALQGRIHVYEGYSVEQAAFPVRVLSSLGVRLLIITNAAGGINAAFRPGDLMVITDHINLMGANPLEGPNIEELGPRFPDMSEAYDQALRAVALEAARKKGIALREGVYAGLRGPSYETPAEIRMLRLLGADAVGMSTIPEVIAANHMGIRVLGISCITNMAAGLLPRKLSHQEVMETAEQVKDPFQSLLTAIIPKLAPGSE